ncbi:TraB/GumN family protein [Blautia coccoides]|uniref:TraB/GumN family protein n=1 Tax=Lachnospiraceae TaxID=186803 RepID=UPI002149E302|nr:MULTISPECIES: TraB/GumN family protein [Lachnospiraceae]MCR1984917.1 TraB/GumN family protein [Blautia coccoides]MCU0077879.1 TraB/GumN family protein [Extibacter muris]
MADNITTIRYEDKEITLIGTAHVLHESVELVKQTIDYILPDTICIELDAERYKNLQNPKAWENTSVAEVIRSKKAGLLFASIILSSYQKRIAKNLNTVPGQEMLQGIESAKEHSCELVLADRDIQTTFLRVWRRLSLLEKCKLFSGFLTEEQGEGEDVDLNILMEKDSLEAAISNIDEEFPKIAEILINERDQHLAYKIKTAPGKKIVAVVGAAHAAGIQREIFHEQNLESITSVPESKSIFRVFAWMIPSAVFLLIAYGFISSYQTGLQQLKSWVIWNSVLAGAFTTVMMGHPISIITAFISAPITSLNPFLACGWFVGLTEAAIRKPTVDDINRVPDDIFHIKRFFKNRFLKAMVIMIFANIGSSIGTLIAGADIIRNLL